MKGKILQPPYPAEGTPTAAKVCLQWMLRELDALTPGEQDLVLLPEFANAPGLVERRTVRAFAENQGQEFLGRVAATASRLDCLVAVGAVIRDGSRWANRTFLFTASANKVLYYDKIHLTDFETRDLNLTPGSKPAIFESKGIRLAVAVCFDLYFPEFFEVLATGGTDIILSPSYQRSETAERIRLVAQARALDSGAYLIRSSYSMGDAEKTGHSLVASPAGTIIADAGPVPGVLDFELDPAKKFEKTAYHNGPQTVHRTLLETHRRKYLYRPYAERVQKIAETKFPQLCAHRGLSDVCPESTLPAFAAAIAVGVNEIEFDLWPSFDGVPVVCHDETVDRTTDGQGKIMDLAWTQLLRFDAGVRFNQTWRGLKIPRLEEVIDLADNRCGLNIHIKDTGPEGRLVKLVCDRLRERGLTKIAYIAGDTLPVLKTAFEYAPEIPRACLVEQENPERMIETAKEYLCSRVQFYREVTAQQIRSAHEAGLICNFFWSDEINDALEYIRKGIDVVLTNCAHRLIADGFPRT